MFQKPVVSYSCKASVEFLEKHNLYSTDFFDSYYTSCPRCNNPYLFVYTKPTEKANGVGADVKYKDLCCMCNRCRVVGPLISVRGNPGYIPVEGIRKFIYDCQCVFAIDIASALMKSIPKIKNYPSMELLSRIGIDGLENNVLAQFVGFLGYTTRATIMEYSNRNLTISQKLPYKISKDTWGLVLPIGPRPGFHTGFVVVYEDTDDIEIYNVRDSMYKNDAEENCIFFNCIINNFSTTRKTIKEAGALFLDRADENGFDLGVYVRVTKHLAPIDPLKQTEKTVRSLFGYNIPGSTPIKLAKLAKTKKPHKQILKRKRKPTSNKPSDNE